MQTPLIGLFARALVKSDVLQQSCQRLKNRRINSHDVRRRHRLLEGKRKTKRAGEKEKKEKKEKKAAKREG